MNDSGVGLKPRSTIQAEIDRLAATRKPEGDGGGGDEGPERNDPLPRPGSPYQPHARRTAKPQMTLFFVGKTYLPDGYAYANLERVWLEDGDKPGSLLRLIARFYGSVVTEAVIEGRHLFSLCNDIGMHLMPWVWEHPSPKDFVGEDETVIRKISFRQVER